MCPHNDLSDLAIDQMLDAFESGYNNSASDQCSILADGNQCVTSFGLDTVASTWYNPGQLPSGFPGTAPLSDTSGSLTSAPAPYTYSVFPSYISVITPAPYNAKNAAGTGTVVETSSATGTAAAGASATGASAKTTSGSTTGSTTGAASSSTGQKGAAPNLVSQISFGYGTWGLAIQIFACALLSRAVVA
ncbi:hypothetical protein EIK77_006650 [Talaromyces pinophilus]|nr:hypothetical protein EIK77_006650 [Talaromyces pinophilus]